MTVGRVGVGAAAVERTARRRCHSLPVTSPGAQEEDGRDDGDHQDQSCHGYANGEIAGRYAQLILVHRLFDGIAGEEAGVPVVGGVADVEAAEDFDGGVLSKDRVVDAVLGPRLLRAATPTTPQVIALLIAQWRLLASSVTQT